MRCLSGGVNGYCKGESMSDKFTGCSIDKLLCWILAEEKTGQIFGLRKELFFVPAADDGFKLRRYGRLLATPIGVAAGPHTQLAQNIITAYLAGARYIELKTVQTLDELAVTKPCIDMTDEGYNCEWSQELKLHQSFDEYLNAWIILHILEDRFGWGEPGQTGFIFNMSVGYNLEGIMNPNVQTFLDRMTDCAAAKAARIELLKPIYPRVADLEIPDRISDNLTVSTMHGCPPDEIEKIGRYFIEARKLNTTIKLNPTLLGPKRLRRILNNELGFDVAVPDDAFGHDLKYEAGVDLIRSLLAAAAKNQVAFNLKLTNTLETTNREQNLPGHEKMVYMSGRALHPVSINLARRLQTDFDGQLDISFSAGADCFNLVDVLACNLKPVTVCSDILKPGGYGRLGQYLEAIKAVFTAADIASLDALVTSRGDDLNTARAGLNTLNRYADAVVNAAAYQKTTFACENIKVPRELTAFDCVQAPCVATCPAAQDIPRYMYHTARGEFDKALDVILATNPFPNVQGMVCDHLCQYKCTRMNYDSPLLIRAIKRFVAQTRAHNPLRRPAAANNVKVAVIGAGPSGLACAYFLALQGFAVEVFERKQQAGGMAADGIPLFRLDNESLRKDIDAIEALGVVIRFGITVDADRFAALRSEFDYVYIAIGAQRSIRLGIPGEQAAGIHDQLEFLSAVRRGQAPDLGQNVAVVGGGNSAMDAARTAKRLVGPAGNVSVLYRRTRPQMPADAEEIQAAVDEGVALVELTAPECFLVEDGRVTANLCFQMKLGGVDAGGRPRPVRIEGSAFEFEVDSVITAIGQEVELDFLPGQTLQTDPDTLATQLDNVFAGGDAVRGASTLIRAIADGKRVAEAISRRAAVEHDVIAAEDERAIDIPALQWRQARREPGARAPEIEFSRRFGFDPVTRTLDEAIARKEAARCLQCDVMCNVCTTVCPNRANIAYRIEPVTVTVQRAVRAGDGVRVEDLASMRIRQSFQIINIGDLCNECGNCTTFCPTDGAPYNVKPKFYLSKEAFEGEADGYHLADATLQAKVNGRLEQLTATADGLIYTTEGIQARLNAKSLAAEEILFTSAKVDQVELRHAAQMAVMFGALKDIYLFKN